MKGIVLGRGFLGKKFEMKGFEVFGKNEFYMDFSNTENSLKQLSKYDVIINCMGKSNTRYCENRENFEEVLYSNGFIPKILSKFCQEKGKKFVHISTGCLYDKKGVAQRETDFIAAHCNYTLTKWVGEQGCNPNRDLILRPRLYFSDFNDDDNLLCKLSKFKQFVEEQNSFSSLDVIVDSTKKLLEKNQAGIFNVACEENLSVIAMARLIGLDGKEITEEELHKSEGLYLINNIMDLSKLKKFYSPPKLKDEVLRCYKNLK
ncbi:MAG: sugar nucleotide-binding protein [Candidatus Pacearchaeota archaeon]